MLNVICVNKGNYLGRGDEYVEKLRAAVKRHLLIQHRFHVITDAPGDGWWAKISLFEPGRFEGRCIYFDLDTLIVGTIDHFAFLTEPFIALSDFFHPHHLASGVMSWEAGEGDHIYARWEAAGRPSFDPRGDGGWIESMMPNAHRLQDLLPGYVVSFKAHCANGIPHGARIVCFHGLPRPHAMKEIMNHW